MNAYNNFTEAYVDLVRQTYENYTYVSSPRGHEVRENIGISFSISDPRNRLPYVKSRKFSIQYLIAELVWYLTGNSRTAWISNYSSVWKNISDDGINANSAYGARIFAPHRLMSPPDSSQWEYVVNELINDNDSRRAVIHIRSPKDSWEAKLDVPCTLSLQFFLRGNALDMCVTMRSSDIIFGLSYDVPAFTIFQELMAITLSHHLNREIELGTYYHTSNSLHIYQRHYSMAENILQECVTHDPQVMDRLPTGRFGCNDVWEHIDNVYKFEDAIKHYVGDHTIINYDDPKEFIDGIYRTLDSYSQSSTYFNDWINIIASKWAKRAKAPGVASAILSSCDFEGYSFFE